MKRKIIMLLLGLSIVSFTACGTTTSTNNEVPTMSNSTEVITEGALKEETITEDVSKEEVIPENVTEIVEKIDEVVEKSEITEPKPEIEESENMVYTYTEMVNKSVWCRITCSIRDLPSEKGNIIGELKLDDAYVATAQCNETKWYQFDWDGTIAYVDDDYVEILELIDFMPEPTPEPKKESEKEPRKEPKNEVIGYDEYGNEIVGYTDDGYPIHRYDTDGTPIIMFYPEENTSNTSNTSTDKTQGGYYDPKRKITYSLPYIINGIDIRTGDWNGDGKNDNNGNTWYEGQTWTASNGYVLRIADKYYVQPGGLAANDSVIRDGTESLEPNSPFSIAQAEYLGRLDIISISPKDLPSVNTVSTKQTSINVNDPSFVAYKAAFDPLWKQQNTGSMSELSASSDGIALLDATLGFHYLWSITYDASRGDWAFKVRGSYTELGWNAVKNSIRMITPDADAVFDTIYKDCYEGGVGLDCEKYSESDWITVGSTQLKCDYTSGTLYYRFK